MCIGKNTLNHYYSQTDYSEMYQVAMGMLFHHAFTSLANSIHRYCHIGLMVQAILFPEDEVGDQMDNRGA